MRHIDMDTLPDKFVRYYRQTGTYVFWIVKVTADTDSAETDWYFSTTDMDIGVTVHGLLLNDDFRIEWSIDPPTRRWSISGIDIRLSNKPYKGPRINRIRLSDEGILSADDLTVEVYVGIGPTIRSLNDAYRVFTGYVVGEPTATADEIILSCEDIGTRLLEKMLPMTRMGDHNPSSLNADNKLSIVLGDMRGREPFGGGNYMVPGLCETAGTDFYAYFVDHTTAEDGDVWVYFEDLDAWMKLDQDAMGLYWSNGSGDSRYYNEIRILQCDTLHVLQGWLYLPPKGVSNFIWTTDALTNEGDYNAGMNKLQDADLAQDFKTGTYASLFQANTPARANAQFYWPDYTSLERVGGVRIESRTAPPRHGRLAESPPFKHKRQYGRLYYVYPNFDEWTMSRDTGDTPDDYGVYLVWLTEKNPNLTYTYGLDGTTIRTSVVVYRASNIWGSSPRTYAEDVYETSDMHDGTVHVMGLDNFAYYSGSGGWNMPADGVTVRFPVYVSAATDDWMLRIKGVFMRCYVTTDVPLSSDVKMYFAPAGYPMDGQLAARRGTDSYSNNLCEWPGDQTEMLLRWPIGLDDDNIDTDSFDAAYSPDHVTSAIITENDPVSVGDLLQELSENGNYCLFFDAAGKTRLIAIDQPQGESPGPTTNAIIPYYDLADSPELYQTDLDQVLNRITVYYDYNPSEGAFNKQKIYENATSQTAYGVREHTGGLQLRYFDDTYSTGDIDTFMAMTLTATPSLLGKRHKGIRIETIGMRWVHLQIGDWIELDNDTTSPFISFHGESWTGEQFLIIGKTITKKSVSFTAVQLI
jgi:hypothetical protein